MRRFLFPWGWLGVFSLCAGLLISSCQDSAKNEASKAKEVVSTIGGTVEATADKNVKSEEQAKALEPKGVMELAPEELKPYLSLIPGLEATDEIPISAEHAFYSDDQMMQDNIEVISFTPQKDGAMRISETVVMFPGFSAVVKLKNPKLPGEFAVGGLRFYFFSGSLYGLAINSEPTVLPPGVLPESTSPEGTLTIGGTTVTSVSKDRAPKAQQLANATKGKIFLEFQLLARNPEAVEVERVETEAPSNSDVNDAALPENNAASGAGLPGPVVMRLEDFLSGEAFQALLEAVPPIPFTSPPPGFQSYPPPGADYQPVGPGYPGPGGGGGGQGMAGGTFDPSAGDHAKFAGVSPGAQPLGCFQQGTPLTAAAYGGLELPDGYVVRDGALYDDKNSLANGLVICKCGTKLCCVLGVCTYAAGLK